MLYFIDYFKIHLWIFLLERFVKNLNLLSPITIGRPLLSRDFFKAFWAFLRGWRISESLLAIHWKSNTIHQVAVVISWWVPACNGTYLADLALHLQVRLWRAHMLLLPRHIRQLWIASWWCLLIKTIYCFIVSIWCSLHHWKWAIFNGCLWVSLLGAEWWHHLLAFLVTMNSICLLPFIIPLFLISNGDIPFLL